MTEFQAGDIVECTTSHETTGYTPKGRFYRVEGPYSRGNFSPDVRLAGVSSSCHPSRFRLAFRPPAGEVWEPWNGGECPVGDGARISYVTQGGEPRRAVGPFSSTRPVGLAWHRPTHTYDIIAYRVIPAEAERDASATAQPGSGDHVLIAGHLHTWADGRWNKVERAASIDPDAIKAGDALTIRVVVREAFTEDHNAIVRASCGGAMTISPEDIVTHTPKARPLEVGDRVRRPDGTAGEVRSLDGDLAWVEWGNRVRSSRTSPRISDLTRIEDPS